MKYLLSLYTHRSTLHINHSCASLVITRYRLSNKIVSLTGSLLNVIRKLLIKNAPEDVMSLTSPHIFFY